MLIHPLHRVLRAYDRAIGACERRDCVAAYRSLGLLRASLELDSPQAIGFDGIYAWCEQAVSAGDFAGATRHLRALREAWATVDVSPQPMQTPRGRSVVLAFESPTHRHKGP